jgi:hypothetical protein
MSDLIERLRRVESSSNGERISQPVTNWLRNPDGPEAADEIGRLRNKLNTDSQNFEIECHKATIDTLRRALAEARAERSEYHGKAAAQLVLREKAERELAEARAVIGKASRDLNARDYAGAHRLLDAFLAKEQP